MTEHLVKMLVIFGRKVFLSSRAASLTDSLLIFYVSPQQLKINSVFPGWLNILV